MSIRRFKLPGERGIQRWQRTKSFFWILFRIIKTRSTQGIKKVPVTVVSRCYSQCVIKEVYFSMYHSVRMQECTVGSLSLQCHQGTVSWTTSIRLMARPVSSRMVAHSADLVQRRPNVGSFLVRPLESVSSWATHYSRVQQRVPWNLAWNRCMGNGE